MAPIPPGRERERAGQARKMGAGAGKWFEYNVTEKMTFSLPR